MIHLLSPYKYINIVKIITTGWVEGVSFYCFIYTYHEFVIECAAKNGQ
jgi:hypothetical protein